MVCSIFFLSCKENDEPVQPKIPPENVYQYFPAIPNSMYKYELFDLANDSAKIGIRKVEINSDTAIGGRNYSVYRIINSNQSVFDKFFRRTERGLYFFFDSTYARNIQNLLPFFGDSVQVVFDMEMNYLSLPPQDSLAWNVFKANLVYNNFITYSFIRLKSYLVEKGNFVSDQLGLHIPSLKYRYELNVVIPRNDLTQPPDEFTFFAAAEYGIDVGLLNISGDSIVIDFLFGREISFFYQNKLVLQKLVEFSNL